MQEKPAWTKWVADAVASTAGARVFTSSRIPQRRSPMTISITRVYTRLGDRGETGLVGGKRVPKDSPRIVAYGTIDELNAIVGIAHVQRGASGRGSAPPLARRGAAADPERAVRPRQRAGHAAGGGVRGDVQGRRGAGHGARAPHGPLPEGPRAAQVVHAAGRRPHQRVPPPGAHRLPPRGARGPPAHPRRARTRG